MTVLKTILIALSFLAGVYCIHRLRRLDIHEKEPFWKMAATVVFGGILSIILTLFIYHLLMAIGVPIYTGGKFGFLFVGFVEEGAKLVALLACWPIIRKELDEPTDGLIYMACVAMGFSLIENYFYAARSVGSAWLIAFRLIVCTPMHISFSLLMGLALYRATKLKLGWSVLGWAYLFGSLGHAFYDIVVSTPILIPTIYFFVVGAYRWMYRWLGYTTAQSPFRVPLKEWLAKNRPSEKADDECLKCGCTKQKPVHTLGRIRMLECKSCGSLQCTQEALCRIVHHFGSAFGSLRKASKDWAALRVLVDTKQVDEKKGVACIHPDDLHAQLETLSQNQVAWVKSQWWYRKQD